MIRAGLAIMPRLAKLDLVEAVRAYPHGDVQYEAVLMRVLEPQLATCGQHRRSTYRLVQSNRWGEKQSMAFWPLYNKLMKAMLLGRRSGVTGHGGRGWFFAIVTG